MFHDAAVHGLFDPSDDDPVAGFEPRQDFQPVVIRAAGPDQAVGDDPLTVHGIDAGELSLFDDGGTGHQEKLFLPPGDTDLGVEAGPQSGAADGTFTMKERDRGSIAGTISAILPVISRLRASMETEDRLSDFEPAREALIHGDFRPEGCRVLHHQSGIPGTAMLPTSVLFSVTTPRIGAVTQVKPR